MTTLAKVLRRVPLRRKGFDDFLAPSNLSQVAMPHAVGRGEPVHRVADLDDVVATFQAVAGLSEWVVLLAAGWDEERSVKQLRRSAREIRRLARSIVVACDQRLEVLSGEDEDS